jgi:phosphoribosylaminoimidazole carboxylase PurK protein
MTKKRIGIVGGGQLGRMLAQAAQKLGFEVTTLDPAHNGPAAQVANAHIAKPFDAEEGVSELAQGVDVITFEIESAHADTLRDIAGARPGDVHPSPQTLGIIRDKYEQKRFFESNSIPVAASIRVDSKKDIEAAAERFGYPVILKSRFGAYDGRGNARLDSAADIDQALEKLRTPHLYVEQYVPFEKELAVVAARSVTGECALYPVVETIHRDHICHTVFMPAPVSASVQKEAEHVALSVLRALNGAGVFGIELFLTKEGKVLVNEVAPRVHNSGHITMDANETSQFEQHIRAITAMPLGSTAMRCEGAVMINILGDRNGVARPEGIAVAEALGDTRVYIYGKQETKLGRKMGHINVCASSLDEAFAKASQAREHVSI